MGPIRGIWKQVTIGLAALRRTLNRYPAHGATAALGRRGEDAAVALLKRAGYVVIARNVRVPMGEADVICRAPDGQTIVIVEVKTRERGKNQVSDQYAPEAAITARKRKKLRRIASYLSRRNGWSDRRVRIDVIAVEIEHGAVSVVRHSEGVV